VVVRFPVGSKSMIDAKVVEKGEGREHSRCDEPGATWTADTSTYRVNPPGEG